MYIALTRFADLQDKKHIYEAGAEYPRLGYTPTESRIAELSGNDNRMGFPLIKAVDEPVNEPVIEDVAKQPEMPLEAAAAQDDETLKEQPETARKGHRGRQKG